VARASLSRRSQGRRGSPVRLAVSLAFIGLAVAAAFAPMNADLVERYFSRGWYPAIQPLLTSASSLASFALLDVWIVAGVLLLSRAAWRVWHESGRARWRALGRAIWRGAVTTAVLYLVFLACWGLNYRRAPLASGFNFDRARVHGAAVDQLAVRAVAQLNALHAPAHVELAARPTRTAIRMPLVPAFSEAQRALGSSRLATPGRPKVSMLSPFFRWASVDGMVNPFGLEVLVNPDVLPVELPFVIAHEWGHLAGWAHESEASYLAWVMCLGGDRAAQYSGWLSIYWHLRRALPRERLPALEGHLDAGPRQDLRAIAARLARGQPAVQRASWHTYDQFLKANRVDAGIASYDEVLTLILGIAADEAGRPKPVHRQDVPVR
jgi:hypothetical protein